MPPWQDMLWLTRTRICLAGVGTGHRQETKLERFLGSNWYTTFSSVVPHQVEETPSLATQANAGKETTLRGLGL